MSFSLQDVKNAYENIKDYLPKTPLEQSFYLGDGDRKVYFKLETLHRAKSFKIRGALNKMLSLSAEEKARGVATISSGNNGSAVSYAASLLKISNVKVIVPTITPKSKIDKIKYFGGEPLLIGGNYDEAHSMGMSYIEEHGLTYIDAYDKDAVVYAGQGTTALEILEQNSEIDTIVIPIGGGGLATGIAVAAKALKPDIRIVCVQTAACPAMLKSIEDNTCYSEFPNEPSICESLVGGIGELAFTMLPSYMDELVIVSEEEIAKSVSFMAKEEKYIAEAGSCVTVAAVKYHGDKVGGKNIALIISGANIDGGLLTELLNKY